MINMKAESLHLPDPSGLRPGQRLCRRARKARSGFTLIELLVVIAIIAILASILVPSVTKALQRARMISNVSLMRQIGLAISQHAHDHDGLLPPSYRVQRARMRDFPGHLSSYTAPYLDVDQIEDRVNPYFGDPIWTAALGQTTESLPLYLRFTGNAHRFILNKWNGPEGDLFPWGSTFPDTPSFLVDQVPTPSSLWALQDLDAGIIPGHPLSQPLWEDRRVALFFDGHVNTLSSDQYFSGPLPESQ